MNLILAPHKSAITRAPQIRLTEEIQFPLLADYFRICKV
jgi:hypothetical protein